MYKYVAAALGIVLIMVIFGIIIALVLTVAHPFDKLIDNKNVSSSEADIIETNEADTANGEVSEAVVNDKGTGNGDTTTKNNDTITTTPTSTTSTPDELPPAFPE